MVEAADTPTKKRGAYNRREDRSMWRRRWVLWLQVFYGSILGMIGPAFGVAHWSFENGYVPWGQLGKAGVLQALFGGAIEGAILFLLIAFIHIRFVSQNSSN